MYTTLIPASLTNLNGSSLAPLLLWPEAIIKSGSSPIIVSASGFKKSIFSTSLPIPSTSDEYVSIATNLSLRPNPTNISVFAGAVDTILSILSGNLTSLPLCLLQQHLYLNNQLT